MVNVSEKTAHLAEALKCMHKMSEHVYDAMELQVMSEEAANDWYNKDYQPKEKAVEDFIRRLLGDIVSENAGMAAAAATDSAEWQM